MAPPDQPPFLEFSNRATGTLPESIGASELETLNLGLRFLFALLREARRQFDQEGDNGRLGAFTALGALWRFVTLFEVPLAESLQVPILQLQDALVGLNQNLVSPIVEPNPRHGRAPSSQTHATLKGLAAGTVKRLVEMGLSSRDAQHAVANRLDKLGIRPERGSGKVTSATVRNWCHEVSTDVGRHGTSAQMHDSMFERPEEQQRFSEMPIEEAKRNALNTLAGWVKSVFPKPQKTT